MPRSKKVLSDEKQAEQDARQVQTEQEAQQKQADNLMVQNHLDTSEEHDAGLNEARLVQLRSRQTLVSSIGFALIAIGISHGALWLLLPHFGPRFGLYRPPETIAFYGTSSLILLFIAVVVGIVCVSLGSNIETIEKALRRNKRRILETIKPVEADTAQSIDTASPESDPRQ